MGLVGRYVDRLGIIWRACVHEKFGGWWECYLLRAGDGLRIRTSRGFVRMFPVDEKEFWLGAEIWRGKEKGVKREGWFRKFWVAGWK